jgi:hypothetical protein
MTRDDELARSMTDALGRSRSRELKAWLLTAVWLLGAVVVVWFLVRWSLRLSSIEAGLQSQQEKAADVSAALDRDQRRIERLAEGAAAAHEQAREAGHEIGAARAELGAKLGDLEGALQRFDLQQRSSKAETARRLQELSSLQARYESELQRLENENDDAKRQFGTILGQLRELDARRESLEREWNAKLRRAEQQIQDIERELQSAHFVLKTRSRNQVFGMDLWIEFKGWKKAKVGIDAFCVAASKDGPCLHGPEFLPLGVPVVVDVGPARYSIVARYAVGMLFAHDQVGFDINRQVLAHATPEPPD